jgi:hypothetical protein
MIATPNSLHSAFESMNTRTKVIMSPQEQRQVSLDYVGGVGLATVYTVGSVMTPQYTFGISPHIPITAILFSAAVGVLLTLIYHQWGPRRSWRMAVLLAFVSTALISGLFALSWYMLSRNGLPLWIAILVGHVPPLLLLLSAVQRFPTQDPGLSLLFQLLHLHPIIEYGLVMLASLFFGYGTTLLGLFLYAQGTYQVFGRVALLNLSLTFLLGAMLAGGIFGLIFRRGKLH